MDFGFGQQKWMLNCHFYWGCKKKTLNDVYVNILNNSVGHNHQLVLTKDMC